MTDDPTPDTAGAVTGDEVNRHTVEELSDYLDRGQTPPDRTIDNSPSAQIVLHSLERLRRISALILDAEAAAEAERDDSWIQDILGHISSEAHAGRTIPYQEPGENSSLEITEGAVRGIIRSAGDSVRGVLVGRCSVLGDVTEYGSDVTVHIDLTVLWGQNIPDTAHLVRDAVALALHTHTELVVGAIDITVRDLQVLSKSEESR